MTIDPAERFDREGEPRKCWKDEYYALLSLWLDLSSQYASVVRAIGLDWDALYIDQSATDEAILARARACKAAYDTITDGAN